MRVAYDLAGQTYLAMQKSFCVDINGVFVGNGVAKYFARIVDDQKSFPARLGSVYIRGLEPAGDGESAGIRDMFDRG